MWWIVLAILVLVVFLLWKIHSENSAADFLSRYDDTLEEPEEDADDPRDYTDPELLRTINSATSFEDLLRVVNDSDSGDFSDKEDLAFLNKAQELKLSESDWSQILEAVNGDGSYIEDVAEDKSGASS